MRRTSVRPCARSVPVVTEVFHWMALAPLAWVLCVRALDRPLDDAYAWIALGFAVSWFADIAPHYGVPALAAALVYPVTQSALVARVFLTRNDAWFLLLVLTNVAIAAALLSRGTTPDVLLTTVAFGAVAGIVLDRPALGWLREALLVYFGLGVIAWWAYVLCPWEAFPPFERGWMTYSVYQGTRFVGLALFCVACVYPAPKLKAV